MDIDTALNRARPKFPEPTPQVQAQHRAALDDAIRSAQPSGQDTADPRSPALDTGLLTLGPRTGPQITARSRGRRRAVLTAAAVVAAVSGVAGGWLLAGNRTPPGMLETGSSLSPTDDARLPGQAPAETGHEDQPAAPRSCGDQFPVSVDLAAGLTIVDGPLPGRTEGREGQLIKHWVGPGLSGELRWPQDPQEIYAPSEADGDGDAGRLNLGSNTDENRPGEVEIFATTAADGSTVSAESDKATVRLTYPRSASESGAGCGLLQIRFVADDDGEQALLFPTDRATVPATNDDQSIQSRTFYPRLVEPLITDQVTTTEAPTTIAACDAEGVPTTTGPGATPPRTDRTITNGGHHNSPAEALVDFVGRFGPSDPNQLTPSGYLELTNPDGSVSYAQGSGLPDRSYATLVTVSPSSGGWAVTHVLDSGC